MGQKRKLETRAIGLDVGLAFIRWLTGAENLHYGLWENGLEVSAANLRTAQEAYTARLLALLPDQPCRILDIGGGAGETAKKLLALGHHVDIVVPSAFLAERCRKNAPAARVYQCRFEEFSGTGPYDLCLFSESFQYIPLDQGLPRCLSLLTDDGTILLADCFRSPAYARQQMLATVGGGHPVEKFRETLDMLPLRVEQQEDVTQLVAPSVDLEQALFNVFGHAITRIDAELAEKRRGVRWLLQRGLGLILSQRKRARLHQRFMQQSRNRDVFTANNVYLILKLARA